MRSRRLIVVAPEAQTTMVAMPPVLWKGLGQYVHVRFGSKADMCGALPYVRFVPIADIAATTRSKIKRLPTEAASPFPNQPTNYASAR